MTYKTFTPTEKRFSTTPVFEWNYSSTARIKINQGGTSSGKTIAILQVLLLRAIASRVVVTVVAETLPNIKKGALFDFEERILAWMPWAWQFIKQYNKSSRSFYFKNGSKIEFVSYKDEGAARSGKRDILFVNEANSISWPIYQQLAMRTNKEIFIDYNPHAPFWVHERLMHKRNAVTFYSNYTHNAKYIDDAVREEIEELYHEDFESWRVYGLGKTGTIQDLVIENMKQVEAMPRHLKRRAFGLDFGYRAHPTTLIECGLLNIKDLYCREIFFTRKMKTNDIDITLRALGLNKFHKIYADPADPRAVDDLQERGWNIIPAIKGPGSVNYGIQLMNQYNIHVTNDSLNMINQRRKYHYKTNKDGEATNEIVKKFDDTWDATRYYSVMNLKPLRKINSNFRGASV